jgi:hypothetical protein
MKLLQQSGKSSEANVKPTDKYLVSKFNKECDVIFAQFSERPVAQTSTSYGTGPNMSPTKSQHPEPEGD